MIAENQKNASFIIRDLEASLLSRLEKDTRVILLFGARRVGKTTLIRHILGSMARKSLELSGDDVSTIKLLS
ncbi:MAG TPA: hypothetical protein DIT55_01600, partial [Spirochaetaceae bacterium]|nr:hypothetical protein [Spirochaetaceae bacterium]